MKTTEEIIRETIYNNDYVYVKPYPRQLWPIFEITEPIKNDEPHSILAGGGAYGGKTYLGSMLAAQYLEFPEYQCLVTRKNRKELIGPNSIWRNLKEWLTREELGPLRLNPRKDINKSDLVMTAPSGATIWFRYYEDEEAMGKLQSESYDRIIHDEAPQLRPRVLKFSYRSLRHGNYLCKIPLAMILLGNPSVDKHNSTEYVAETFVDGDYSYYWIDWRHNPFAPTTYRNTLTKLDYIDQKLQLDGDWKYRPAKGDLFPESLLVDSKIDRLPSMQIVRNLRGIDAAISEGSNDYTALVKWLQDQRGHAYVTDVVKQQTAYPEDLIATVVELDNPGWQNGTFQTDYYMELGDNEAGILARRLIKSALEEYIEKGLSIRFLKPIPNKFTRARPMGRGFLLGRISILNQTNVLGDEWVEDFITEYKDFGPDPREYDHDDQVDGGSVGYNQLNKDADGYTESEKRYYAATPKPEGRKKRSYFIRR